MATYTITVLDPQVLAGLEYRASLAGQTVEVFLGALAARLGEAVALPDQPNSDIRIVTAVAEAGAINTMRSGKGPR